MLRLLSAAVVTLLALSTAGSARAQDNLDMQLFLPPAGGGTTFTIARPAVPRHLTWVFGVGANYGYESFSRSTRDPNVPSPFLPGPIVRHLGQAEAMVALGLFEFLELGLVAPLQVVDRSTDPFALDLGPTYGTQAAATDLRVNAKIPILRGDFSLAAQVVIQLPLGSQGNFVTTQYWVPTPSVTAAWDVGALTLAAELGYRLRQRRTLGDFELDDEVHLAGGINVPIIDGLEAIAETQLRIGTGGRSLRANEIPMEADGGVRIRPASNVSIDVGLGTALLRAYGAPTVRVFAVARFATENEQQSCAGGPEDFDGFEDGDFCLDPDNDGDGIQDPVDDCVNDAEDFDGFQDGDGCPDSDNDADGAIDDEDSCPTQSEDRDGFQDADGCPEPDNDEDRIADGFDECPMEPEDLDGYQDDDGCPEPGPARAAVTVTDTRILISERIYFDFDRDTIRSVSQPLLDQVAAVVSELSGDLRVRVDGYTDSEGLEDYNVDLSYRRARAVVEYLVSRGVARARLEYRGYGPRNPVAPNDSPEGRALNRRVEFTILHPRLEAE